MAFLRNYKWDVFISYAEADNDESAPSRRWISMFHKRLLAEAPKNMPREREIGIFFAQRSLPSYKTIGSIVDAVKESGLFLVIGSPNWVQSRWCREELETFLGCGNDTTRLFVAELEPPEAELGYPDDLPDNLRRKFWRKGRQHEVPMPLSSTDSRFEETLKLLAMEIRARLRSLDQAAPTPSEAESQADQAVIPLASKIYAGQKIFLAHGPADLDVERREFIAYLKPFGVEILQLPSPLPESVGELNKSLDQLLGSAGAYVQLLGRRKSDPLVAGGESLTYLQLGRAKERMAKEDIFVWRPEDIDPVKNPDVAYRAYLDEGRTGSHKPHLAQAVLGRLKSRLIDPGEPGKRRPGAPLSLVINADREDRAKARELIKACSGRKCRVILDRFGFNEAARKEWLNADAVAYVQGKSAEDWLPARYHEFNRERANQGLGEPKGQLVIYAPPPPKEPGDIGGGDDVIELNLSKKWSVKPFEEWLDKIGAPRTGSA